MAVTTGSTARSLLAAGVRLPSSTPLTSCTATSFTVRPKAQVTAGIRTYSRRSSPVTPAFTNLRLGAGARAGQSTTVTALGVTVGASVSVMSMATRGYAKKSRNGRSRSTNDSEDSPSSPSSSSSSGSSAAGKKGKKGKSSSSSSAQAEEAMEGEEDVEEADAKMVETKVEPKMKKSVEWCKATVFEAVERAKGRLSPALLDSVRVQSPHDGSFQPLEQFASVTTRQGAQAGLWVEIWDSDSTKAVESAIRKANLPGISPIKQSETTLKIPVSRPTQEHRDAILKSINSTVETAKQQIRLVRADGMKAIKDKAGKNSVSGKEIQSLTESCSAEVDALIANAKKELAK